jgi:hypothetical protein
MSKVSGRAREIIEGVRTILFAVGLKSRSGAMLGAPWGGMVERQPGKMMDGAV